MFGWSSTAASAALGLSMVLGSASPVAAQPAADETQRARGLYDRGREHYEAGDYDAALKAWGEAYGLVSDAPENDRPRYELIYSIASAHEHAYEQDGDPAHLRKARDLLLKCQAAAAEVFAGDAAAIEDQQKRVRTLLDRVVDRMVANGSEPKKPPDQDEDPQPSEARPPPPGADPPPPEPEPDPPTLVPSARPPAPDTRTPTDPRAGRAMFGAGLGLIGLGVAGLGVMVAGMAIAAGANDFGGLQESDLDGRAAQIRRGRLGNGLSGGGAITASVAIPVGIALTAIGAKQKKGAILVGLDPGGAAIGWRGRF